MSDGLNIRGDSYYCPLAFSIDCYWNCLTDCHHCYFRRLNRTWGQDLRPIDTELLSHRLTHIPKGNSPMACAIRNKKTIRLGNKTDPFQVAERKHRVSKRVMEILLETGWTFVIQTRFTHVLADYEELLSAISVQQLATIMPVLSPGQDRDWELFERGRTTPPRHRLDFLRKWAKRGCRIGLNGEPFIPGFHTAEDFEDTIKLIKSYGIKSYNTYNLHANDHVYKRFSSLGLDIEKIWTMNQNDHWRPIFHELIGIARKHDIILGCPDFVNSEWEDKQRTNTCCGINVPNPTTYNTHHWKHRIQAGENPEDVLEKTWDGIGEREKGRKIFYGEKSDFYTMKDIGKAKEKHGFGF